MPPAPSSFHRLDAWLRRARRRVLLRGLLRCAAFALGATLVYEVLSTAAYLVLGEGMYFPPFPLLAFAVLAFRERRSWSAAGAAGRFDAEFALKDRLRTYVEFSRRDDVPPEWRRAQAAECVASVPLDALAARFRVRPPWAFWVVLPLYLGLAAARTFVAPEPLLLVLGPDAGRKPGAAPGGGRGGADPVPRGAEPGEGEPARPPEGEPRQEGTPEAAGPGEAPRPQGAPGGPQGKPGADGEAPGARTASTEGFEVETPPSLESTAVTAGVGEPMEVSLEGPPAAEVERLREALHSLALLPSRLGVAAAPGGTDAVLFLGWKPDEYPARYRDHLRAYAAAITRTGEEPDGTPGETR